MTDIEGSEHRVFGGRYEIQSKIARGGMADVFLARDQLLDRPVALKVLFPELSVDPSFVERFRREAQNAAKLSHPNVVSVYDWGEDESTYYIVMEYVDGKPLSNILRENGPLQPRRAAAVGADVAAALSFAHRNGVVHRDVKPGNVLIDERGLVKVTDFGIARARNTTENLTQTGAVMGTATYFSPEQAQGMTVDQRSDVYSLGVVLYELVAGRPPFQGDNPVTIAYKHVREAPPALRDINPNVPPEYQAIVSHAVAKNPAGRYPSAEDLRADLERFKQGAPISAAAMTPGPDATQVNRAAAAAAYGDSTRAIPTIPPQGGGRPEPQGKGVAGPLMVFVALLAALAIGAVVLFNTGLGGSSNKPVTVPDVTNKTKDEAEDILKAAKLRAEIVPVASELVKDTVISQDPAAGETAKENDKITLNVSEGPGAVEVPDVANQTLDAARKALQKEGFVVKTVDSPSDSVDKGKVISQDPQAGASIEKGATVTLDISTGTQQVEVPDVVGFTISTASQALSDAGLKTSLPPGAKSTDLVASTNPPAASQVAKNSTVVLTPQTTTTTSEKPSTTTTSTTEDPGGGGGNN